MVFGLSRLGEQWFKNKTTSHEVINNFLHATESMEENGRIVKIHKLTTP